MPARPPLRPPTLADDHVVLRPLARGDVRAVVAACQDAEIQRWTRVPSPYTREDAERFLALAELEASAGRGLVLAVCDPDDALVGTVGLADVEPDRGTAQIGYWTAPGARGRGTTTRAVVLLRDWAHDALGLRWIEILPHADNAPSRAVAERAGFAPTGETRRVAGMPEGRRDGYLVYAWPPSA